MKVSVVIPAFNAGKTLRAAVDSALRQTMPPYEILVLDDGSTDDTTSILDSYGSGVSASRQENRGAAETRNTLCQRARGDVVAFLDADDVWHPSYLETQMGYLDEFPEAIACFAGHIDFTGYGDCDWGVHPGGRHECKILEPDDFLDRYCATTGLFGTSWAVIRRSELSRIGNEPFRVHGAEDSYLFTLLPLLGRVGYSGAPLVGRRITEGTLSSDSLTVEGLRLDVFRILEERFRAEGSARLFALFQATYASKQRQYAKRLMGVGRKQEARQQLRASFGQSKTVDSRAKTTALLASSYLPARLQPTWPAAHREWITEQGSP